MGSGPCPTIDKAFLARAEAHPGKTALFYLGTRYTYGRLADLAGSFARSLASLGIQHGERLIIYLPNSPQWVVSWLGILMRGAAAVPITPIYTTHDLRYIANDSGARAIVCTDTNYGYVDQILGETGIRTVIHTSVADLLPWWKRAFGRFLNRVPRGKVAGGGYSIPFKRLLRGKGERPSGARSGDDLAEILYTGGTTKFPKGVLITHRLFLESAQEQLRQTEPLIPRGENVILQGAPLFHILGQVFGMGPLCLTGDSLILLPKVNLDGLMEAVQRHRARSLYGVPALYRMILDHDRVDSYDLSSLRFCFTGGDVLPVEIGNRWKGRFGVPIHQGYGATETIGGVSLSPVDRENPPLSMGKVLPNKRVRIVNPETLQEVGPGAPGELLVGSGPMVENYWNKPEDTREAFVRLDGLLWYRTGDIVTMDEQGYLYFVDRTVDTIKHKGYRVSASEIEAVLQEHPAVVGACVVGVPDSKVGERIKAFVVLKSDIKGMTGHDLIRWCRERLVSYKVPQHIEFRDMLPKSKVGKLLRREVRGEERKRLEKGRWEETLEET
ncbi:MAG: class I adenylate-forming enzyme family protein [Thermodesulfobacteriota bacterium]